MIRKWLGWIVFMIGLGAVFIASISLGALLPIYQSIKTEETRYTLFSEPLFSLGWSEVPPSPDEGTEVTEENFARLFVRPHLMTLTCGALACVGGLGLAKSSSRKTTPE